MSGSQSPAGSPIRVALLGADESTFELLRAVLESPRFELAGLCEIAPAALSSAEDLAPLLLKLRAFPSWELLLETGQVDAVIVSRGDDQDLRTEQLRKLVQVAQPALISHPIVDSMLVYYELDMIRRDTNSVLVPELADRLHPAMQALAEIVRQGESSPIGKVEHLVMERCLATPNKRLVDRQFARDVDAIRAIAGDMTRLGAMAGAPGTPNYAALGVHMHGPAGIDARWSVVAIQAACGAKITLTGARGRVAVELNATDAPWTMETQTGGTPQRQEFAGWNSADAVLAQFAAAIDGRTTGPDWVDACRAVELTETIARSLQKSRTIELYYEDYTEEATFKGMMASLGCGLLLLTLMLLVLVGVLEQMKVPGLGVWRYGLVVVLVVFLGLQLLLLAAKRKAGQSSSASPPADA
jgi:predicted dehydrogenase